MTRAQHEFDRFLRAAHRRWVAWRIAERAGVATLCACALTLPLIVVLWFRGESALWLVSFSLGIGAVLGALWGIRRRPTLLQTAIEADHQFNLHDLLGTAHALSRCAYADEATRATVAALADDRCRRLGSSRLVLNRLGARAWAGIGLANALIVTLSLLTTSPTRTIAQVEDQPMPEVRFDQNANTPTAIAPNRPPRSPARSAPIPAREGIDTADSDGGETGAPRSAVRSRSGAATHGDGAGAGGAQTTESASRAARATANGRDSTTGTIAAGGDGSAAAATIGDDATDAASPGVTRAAQSFAPPWRASTWDADRARAIRDVERGAVPDRYRDMIRAYFDAPESTDHDPRR
jgi:hypothetical protein